MHSAFIVGRVVFRIGLALAMVFAAPVAHAHEPRIKRDIEYARMGDTALSLDLYVPAHAVSPPVIVWVHGGAWRSGSKKGMPLQPLASRFAIASVDYRLSPVVKFPAQVHDLKAAIRFLRAKANEYKINADRIAIAGSSAGGHLAALVGVTNGVKELEGDVGEHQGQSSDVQAIVDFYGPANLTTILQQSTPHGLSIRVPALELLFGGHPDEKTGLAKLASPVFHVDLKDPPLFIFHGDQDPQVPINQSHELVGAYKQNGLAAKLEVVYGGTHGGKMFFTPEQLDQVDAFFTSALKSSIAPGTK